MRLLLLFTLCLPLFAWPHGGGTNPQGCHNNKKTGYYHCHNKGVKRSSPGSYNSSYSSTDNPYSAAKSSSYSTINSTALGYTRADFNYRSYPSSGNIGFYTGEYCTDIDIDHVVSLKDAYLSGASEWSPMEKDKFANDRENHVEACSSVNRSKSDATPREFAKRSNDGKGLEYEIKNWCPYVIKYHQVKTKYRLSTANNDKRLLQECAPSQSVMSVAGASGHIDKSDDREPMDWARDKCDLIGFGEDHLKYFDCVVRLMELL